MKGASSSRDTRKKPVCDELDDGTLSPTPAPNASGMITMTAANLFAFCQQMMATRENAREIREYHKEVQASMDTKAVTTFDGTNYQAWRIRILADAEKALYRRMLQSLLGPVRTMIGVLEPDNAAGRRLVLNTLSHWQRSEMIILPTRGDSATLLHAIRNWPPKVMIFIIISSSTAYETTREPSPKSDRKHGYLDIDSLMKQLTDRTSKTKETEGTKTHRVNAAANDGNPQPSASTSASTFTKSKGRNKNSKEDKANDKMPNLLASQPSANSAIALPVSSEITSKPWYLDTCTSFNMNGEQPPESMDQVKEIGDILLESDGGDIMVRDVHWIPNLTINLLSFAKLEDQGFRFELSSSTPFYFIIRAPNGVIFTAIRTPQSSIYKIIERDSEVHVHHVSKAVNYIAQSYHYGDCDGDSQ
ncbi:hypothetical protein PABG_06794 [Paracoccidioides brasiliensis Pb03]|nr:hypothetical protein PABG_06794 [Paracoccidioides brasiliensis Pb03]